MPRTKKPAGRAVDRRNGRRAELDLSGTQLERFDCPLARPSPDALVTWGLAWADPVHVVWTPADGPILARYIEHWERAAVAARRADRRPVVPGSTGQPSEHPSYGTMARSIAVVEKCEQLLGLGALNRERLGFAIGQARKSIDDLNAGYGGDHDDEPDPRAIAGRVE